MKRIAIFASGSGSNAENIIKYFTREHNAAQVAVVLSNKVDAFVHERSKNLGVPSVTFSKEDFAEGEKIVKYLQSLSIDFIVLAGFLLKVSKPLLVAYPDKIVNIHPALLPKFGGKGMYGDNVHKAVIEANEKESGITIHYVNENYDEGNIIFQARCSVEPGDTYRDVAQKVHQLEYMHYPKVIENVLAKKTNV